MTSDVANFYKNKSIFITGGTGFLGIALIEKILRGCPDVIYGIKIECQNNYDYIFFQVKCIYMLMRPKKGKDVKERLEDFIKNPVSNEYISTGGV